MTRYSIFSLARNALSYHVNWPRAWRSPEPKRDYDVVIVGGGGHGLATAYHLAKDHGITNVAVLEKGWIGLGNTGRNTTVVRSNYPNDPTAHFFEMSLKLWEDLSHELNFNVMFSQRGVINLALTRDELHGMQRRIHALRRNGIDSELLTPAQLKTWIPILNTAPTARYPVLGGALQRRAGVARHDAVAWGYARGADARGVDIIQQCAVTGITREGGRVTGVETSRGTIKAGKVALAVAGHSSALAGMAGLRLPITSYPLQAYVSEPVKPVLDTMVGAVALFFYVSQSDRGELVMGCIRDHYASYGRRGSVNRVENALAAACELYPIFSRLKVMRQWAGIVDVTPDESPIIAKLPIAGLYLNGGWGTGGFKGIPGSGFVFAHTIARDAPHPLNAPFTLERFVNGALVDERAENSIAEH